MPKRHKQASKPIMNEDENEISESQKKHYAKMGYKPYLSSGGKIKWLSFEQHIYEKIKYGKKKNLFTFKHYHTKRTRIGRYIRFVFRFVIQNWVLLFIVFIVLFALMFMNNIIHIISKI